MAVTYKELGMVAELHYRCLPDAFKMKAAEFFRTLDVDGDGTVTLPELLQSNLEGKFGEEFIKDLFYNIDVDGKGFLDFRETLALYYLCMYSGRLCDGCERNIVQGLGYTCFKCWKEGISWMNDQPFSLCLDCYSTRNYQHEHDPLHLMHDFVFFDNLLHDKQSSSTISMQAPVRAVEQTIKQCTVCGDYHESKVGGFTCDVHMAKMRDSTEFVCEWCFSYLCSKCGNLFRDSTTRAEPGKWLQKFVCPSCHQRNISEDCYDAAIQKLRRVLGGVDLLNNCRTCEIKYKNGTLFCIVTGTNVTSSSSTNAPGLSSQQQRQQGLPDYNSTSRNSSFNSQPQVSSYGWNAGGNQSSYSGGTFVRGSGSSNRLNFREEEYDNSPYNQSPHYSGRGGMSFAGSGSRNRSSFREDDYDNSSRGSARASRAVGLGGGVVSRSSSGGSSAGPASPGNRPTLQNSAASALRTAKQVLNVANMAATVFNDVNGGGGVGNGGIAPAAGLGQNLSGGGWSGVGLDGTGGSDVASLAANMFGLLGSGDGGNGTGNTGIDGMVPGVDVETVYANISAMVGNVNPSS